jgi:hypothetical protein
MSLDLLPEGKRAEGCPRKKAAEIRRDKRKECPIFGHRFIRDLQEFMGLTG